jgi:hypothetical protein
MRSGIPLESPYIEVKALSLPRPKLLGVSWRIPPTTSPATASARWGVIILRQVFQELFEGVDGQDHVAPENTVINFSVGDPTTPFDSAFVLVGRVPSTG